MYIDDRLSGVKSHFLRLCCPSVCVSSSRSQTVINSLHASRMNWNLQLLSNLSSLIIEKYQHEDVESFPEEGLLPTTITVLEISELACLKTLDKKGFGELTCLKRLCIIGCAYLETLPKEGLPNSLQHLGILECPLLEAKSQREKGE
ncbi:LRR domain containing protein [Parasponia andersonii]|uniref:LRR domain containing protein n=1 Tax=Parasponia andersonii TaxID=3476 RepID=A0A2P5AD13_PARAD|nr:LRR domain containing protein [Parasponia andersonii]